MNLLIQMKKMKSLKLIYKILSFIKKLLTQLEYKYSIKYKNVIKNKDFIFQIFIFLIISKNTSFKILNIYNIYFFFIFRIFLH